MKPPLFAVAMFIAATLSGATQSFPTWRTVTYRNASGETHVYALQEPAGLTANSSIFIYMHGSAGLEEQGMELFPALRQLLAEKNWIYVCPRDEDYSGLRAELKHRYGQRLIFLSGASAGGASALEEAAHTPAAYKGLILLCPAVFTEDVTEMKALSLTMPVWIVAGERDDISVDASRRLYHILRSAKRPVHYDEIPGGNHNAPLKRTQWSEAVSFLIQPEAK